MGTKRNPATYDCYDKAEPDEPLFVLLARDAAARGIGYFVNRKVWFFYIIYDTFCHRFNN